MRKPPILTEAERAAALAKARISRSHRAQVKAEVRAGSLTVEQVISLASNDEAVAKKLTRPEVQASLTIQKLHPINDVNALTKILGQQTADVIDGSMVQPDSMLLAQAHTLDALFNSLVMHHYRKLLEDAGTSCLTINIQWNMGSMFGVFSRKKKANGQPDNTGQNRTSCPK